MNKSPALKVYYIDLGTSPLLTSIQDTSSPIKNAMNRREAITAGVAALSATAITTTGAQADEPDEDNLKKVRALLKAHDEALTNHDLEGVLATLTADATVMGTGPGEMWSGKEELTDAYEHFFMVFDKGEQNFEYHFREGALDDDMGWMMTSGNVTGKRDGKEFTYPLNISLSVAEDDDKWKIAAMHFSTLTGEKEA
jgi:uncharacterized protein (TIGR02246 family)